MQKLLVKTVSSNYLTTLISGSYKEGTPMSPCDFLLELTKALPKFEYQRINVKLIGVSLNYDAAATLNQTSVASLYKASMALKPQSLGSVFVNFHAPIDLRSMGVGNSKAEYYSLKLSRKLHSQHVSKVPVTLPRLIYFCIFSYFSDSTKPAEQLLLKDLSKMCASL